MFNMFKKKEAFDVNAAIKRLSMACLSCQAYTNVRAKFYYDSIHGCYSIVFECAERELVSPDRPNERFLSVRRLERFRCEDLQLLLETAIEYAIAPDAFTDSSDRKFPDGVTRQIKRINRRPNGFSVKRDRW